jgi:hypothetical protein
METMAEDVIRARRFEVVDDEGQVRLLLDAEGGEAAGVAIFDREGRNRAGFGILLDGSAAVVLKDEGDQHRAALSVGGPVGNVPRLVLFDGDGNIRARIYVHDEGEVSLDFYDVWGQQRVKLGVSEDAGVVLRDKDGNAVEGLTTRSSS